MVSVIRIWIDVTIVNIRCVTSQYVFLCAMIQGIPLPTLVMTRGCIASNSRGGLQMVKVFTDGVKLLIHLSRCIRNALRKICQSGVNCFLKLTKHESHSVFKLIVTSNCSIHCCLALVKI